MPILKRVLGAVLIAVMCAFAPVAAHEAAQPAPDKKGSRIRLELANGDSAVTDTIFTHRYGPRQAGADTIYHDAAHPSQLLLPILAAP